MATMIAWNMTATKARAEVESGSGSVVSCSCLVVGVLNGPYTETDQVDWHGYSAKGQFFCTPSNGVSKKVIIEMQAQGWEWGETPVDTGGRFLIGEIASGCVFAATGPGIVTDKKYLRQSYIPPIPEVTPEITKKYFATLQITDVDDQGDKMIVSEKICVHRTTRITYYDASWSILSDTTTSDDSDCKLFERSVEKTPHHNERQGEYI